MLAVRSMKLLPAVSLMIEASLKSSVDNNKQYPRRPIRSGNPELLHKYELITRELTRTAALVFLRPMVEMGAQFVDRGKPHHAFRHLRLDRAVRVKRVGHAIDHA